MTRPRDGAYLWVTWLSKWMAGETQCEWAPWFRTHYTGFDRAPSDFQLAQWTAEHTQAVAELADEMIAAGETVFREGQNAFKLKVTREMTLAGKPDLVTLDPEGNATVYEVKTGHERQSDLIQTMLYMLCLPAATPIYKGKAMSGMVVYKSGHRSIVPAWSIDEAFKKNVRYFVNQLDSELPLARVPSASECQFCDIPRADCPERVEPPPEDWAQGD